VLQNPAVDGSLIGLVRGGREVGPGYCFLFGCPDFQLNLRYRLDICIRGVVSSRNSVRDVGILLI